MHVNGGYTLRSIAEFCYRRRRYVVVAWILLLVGLFALSSDIGGKFHTEFKLPGSESDNATELMKARGADARSGFQGQVVFKADQGVDDPAVRSAVEGFLAQVADVLDGEEIVSPYEPGHAYQISQDRKIAYAEVNLSDRDSAQYTKDGEKVRKLHEQFNQPGVQLELGGDIFAEQIEFTSELFGLGAAVVILLVVFGSLLAMGLPIATALFGIGCGFAIIGIMTRFLAVPEFTTSVAAMIGIGVGIDYALIIVTRYRQGLRAGLAPREATLLALDTSGRALLFAGITV